MEELQPLFEKGGARQGSAYAKAGILSIATFWWLNPLLELGSRRVLQTRDLDCYGSASQHFHDFHKRYKGSGGGLWSILLRQHWRHIMVTGLLSLLLTLLSYTGPFLIDGFVQSLGEKDRKHSLGVACAFLGAKIGENFLQRQQHFRIQMLGLDVQSALTGYVYWKSLRLSCSSSSRHSMGEVVNYVAADVQQVSSFSWQLHNFWILPLQGIIGLMILYRDVGYAAFVSFAWVLVSIICNVVLAKTEARFQSRMMKAKDERIKVTAESLRYMKTLKLLGWELEFLNRLRKLRDSEFQWLSRYFYIQAASKCFSSASPLFMALPTFAICSMLSINFMTTGKVLSALATFRLLQTIQENVPSFASSVAGVCVSLDRLSNFFQEQDDPMDAVCRLPSTDTQEKIAINIRSGTFGWQEDPFNPTLKNINVEIMQGSTVGVCGPVGSGKSSFLACILGQIPRLSSGKVEVRGTMAYVSQSPWIQNGTIRENILFGSSMDLMKYETALRVCQLNKDLELLRHGDETRIGDRGINLSGGQKKRVQLARALYQEADIYLLDDPLSALDVETSSLVLKDCIFGVLRSKTVILVTHHLQALAMVNQILVLQNGEIVESRPCSAATDFNLAAKWIYQLEEQERDGIPAEVQEGEDEQAEERKTGSVSAEVYKTYLTAVWKGGLIPVILLLQAAYQAFLVASTWWIARMSSKVGSKRLILIFSLLSAGSFTTLLSWMLLVFTVGLWSAQRCFWNMYKSVFQASMAFFDTTPAGRILNRASTDQTSVDLFVPFRLSEFANFIVRLLAIFAIVSIMAWPLMWIFIPVFISTMLIQSYHIKSIRELPRLLEIERAHALHHIEESLNGVITIRAFSRQQQFLNKMLHLLDTMNSPRFYNFVAMECMALRIGLCADMLFCVLLLYIVYFQTEFAIAGVAVTYGLELTTVLIWTLWSRVDVEKRIVSVERILQYSELPTESRSTVHYNQPPENWPSKGRIDFLDVKVAYKPEAPLILHSIRCSFPGGSKVGIVGRTGSGKSTLIQTLFRIVEPNHGKILIDALDISSIDLHVLRSKLGIIPQDPVLFKGSIRYNLDPHEEHSDAEMFEVLRKCQLDKVISFKGAGLDSSVANDGENWSMGQRQLVCLARVMLKQSKIVCLDEATASIDIETEKLIQARIMEDFAASTVITVSHCLASSSIHDNDLIMVLGDGKILESGAPSALLSDPSSLFCKMVSGAA